MATHTNTMARSSLWLLLTVLVSQTMPSGANSEVVEVDVNGQPLTVSRVGILDEPKIEQAVSADASTTTKTTGIHALVDWVRSIDDCFVSDKLDFRPEGVFAKEDIPAGELLWSIHDEATFYLPSDPEDDDDEEYSYGCAIAAWMADEYTLYLNASDYAPFLEHLMESVPLDNTIPTAWSAEARRIVHQIVGKDLEPQGFGQLPSFDHVCEEIELEEISMDGDDAQLQQMRLENVEKAWKLVHALGWDQRIIPLLDQLPYSYASDDDQDDDSVFYNADVSQDFQSGPETRLTARIPISAGQPLVTSWNRCSASICQNRGFLEEYVTPNLFHQRGIVESYPRRWSFETGYDEDAAGMIFEVVATRSLMQSTTSSQNQSQPVAVQWITSEPNFKQLNWMQAHIKRFRTIAAAVEEQTANLASEYEREAIRQYFEALRSDMVEAYRQIMEGPICNADEEDCDNLESKDSYFDDLSEQPDTLQYEFDISESCYFNDGRLGEHLHTDTSSSMFQQIEFEHTYYPDLDKYDTCLSLAGFPQSCTTFRAHYHEVFIHYPASFLEDVKRVLYVGGGDVFILHEILKYPNLEFVYGMELDQQVVRHSFRNYGVQPHFDHPKVRWSFGDAGKTMFMLPEEYYGTFDLVLIDLQTYVADTVMVMPGVSLMDMGMRMLKHDGVLAQNQDFAQREKPYFAKYAVDLVFGDIPHFCQEYINIASNGVNFLDAKPKDHNVHTVYFDATDPKHYGAWTNYHNNVDFDETQVARNKLITDMKEEKAITNPTSYGLRTVIEAEHCTESLADIQQISAKLSIALQEAGFTCSMEPVSNPRKGANGDAVGHTLHFAMKEGFLVVRTWPKLKYASMDILLWAKFGLHEVLFAGLVNAVGSNTDGASSSFRLSTGGMFDGGRNEGSSRTLPPSSHPQSALSVNEATNTIAFNAILGQAHTLAVTDKPTLLVLSPEAGGSDSLAALQGSPGTRIPLKTCEQTDNLKNMIICEEEVHRKLAKAVSESGRIEGIILDPSTPREMGQILHKVLNTTAHREAFLHEAFFVLAPTLEEASEPWRDALMERFRAGMIKFNPTYHIDGSFVSSSGSIRMELFSAGDRSFFSRLVELTAFVKKQTGHSFEIDAGSSGVVSYQPDFRPTTLITNEDYDTSEARAQYLEQRALAIQEVFQFDLQLPMLPLSEGEHVLVNQYTHHWEGDWAPGIVMEDMKDGNFKSITANGATLIKPRHLIRKMDTDDGRLNMGDRVLMRFHEYGREIWRQAYVMEDKGDETFRLRVMTLAADWVVDADREDLIPQNEPSAPLEDSRRITTSKLRSAIDKVIGDLSLEAEVKEYDNLGDGAAFFVHWTGGDATISWDGRVHVDASVFTILTKQHIREVFKTTLMSELGLGLSFVDEMPRGAGRVVSKPYDTFWFGMIGQRQNDD